MRKWLKDFRIQRGLTQEETAILSNISRSYYTHIEKGTKTPTVDVAKEISKTLKFEWVLFFNNDCSLKEQIVVTVR
ncbi:helix-turn-helix transcriptional regulator [Paenisporosarcina sp. TG-14]|uniref:helix-turn-helix transcriptional regulator n=1 Tax=Paenisporosarcina sp. TG-14 TaxID=1231057 RepID=UPI0003714CC0|nr:helix-turn-helix transcriptional regulator [Paenisporosarcina sp. TG-14]